MTVHDLEHLELAYAPPFGSAKDPVNMAGFMASNVLLGDLELWYAKDWPDAVAGTRLIDVRGPEEFEIWHVPGAENVPLADLRRVCATWDTSVPIRLYCAVGFRSYLAYRALVQRGFTDVATLSGGMITFRAYHHVEPSEVDAPTPVISYAETTAGPRPAASGVVVDLDCTGLACPGPIMALRKQIDTMAPGDEVVAHVSDPGFRLDAPAWAAKNGHQMLELVPEGPGYLARFRKGGAQEVGPWSAPAKAKKTFIVFSGELDKVLAAFIIANGALAMGEEVAMFFTFWGLNALRRPDAPTVADRSMLDKTFAAMMPSGPDDLKLSQLNMMGAGTAMMKRVMAEHKVPSVPELIASALAGGAKIVACTMTMDLLGIDRSELIDGVELGGVATMLGDSADSSGTLFI
jgi:peroxiredoxin family protein/rhodanese-related sulfurtransferase/TusA-related sulfurtransferase